MTRPPPISTLFPYPTLSRSPAAMDRPPPAVGDSRAPAPAAGYYTVTVTVADGDQTSSWDVYYVPSSRLVRAIGQSGRAEWLGPFADTVAALGAPPARPASVAKPLLTRAQGA